MGQLQTDSSRPPASFLVRNRHKTRRLNLRLARELVARLVEEWAAQAQKDGGKGEEKEGLRPDGEAHHKHLHFEVWQSCRPAVGSKDFDLHPDGELGVYFIDADEMARLNEQFLGHAGSTDVITFDYQEAGCRGEIFVCVDEAVASAPRFRATWQKELARYVVHGILHLRGYEDGRSAARRTMKKEENRLLKALSRRMDWGKLEEIKHAARR